MAVLYYHSMLAQHIETSCSSNTAVHLGLGIFLYWNLLITKLPYNRYSGNLYPVQGGIIDHFTSLLINRKIFTSQSAARCMRDQQGGPPSRQGACPGYLSEVHVHTHVYTGTPSRGLICCIIILHSRFRTRKSSKFHAAASVDSALNLKRAKC